MNIRKTITELEIVDFATKKKIWFPARQVLRRYNNLVLNCLMENKEIPSVMDFMNGVVENANPTGFESESEIDEKVA